MFELIRNGLLRTIENEWGTQVKRRMLDRAQDAVKLAGSLAVALQLGQSNERGVDNLARLERSLANRKFL
jgi:hypothetical protein